jgi:hypothetical protein
MPDSAKFKDETFIHRDNIEASRRLCPGFMRTTLTLDDDVAALLKRLRKTREVGLKELINEGLWRGLSEMTGPVKRRKRLRTRAVSLGGLRIASIGNIGEALAVPEGENFK